MGERLPGKDPADALVPGRAKQHPRILVVDDDQDIRLLYTNALTGSDYHVDTAEDGEAGWAALRATNYHLLITEYTLSGLTGIELVRNVRRAHMALPVVLAALRFPADEVTRDPSLQLAA